MKCKSGTCRNCGAQIVWFRSSGKMVPINPETVEPGDEEIEHPRHVIHFTTCKPPAKHYKQPWMTDGTQENAKYKAWQEGGRLI